MEFRLIYEGKLGSNKTEQKHPIRRAFHPQLRELWTVHPQAQGERARVDPKQVNDHSVLETKFGFTFAPLVTQKLNLAADLRIVLLRPGRPGSLICHGGDVDNRIKTLLDALRIPQHDNELQKTKPEADETPFFCLLQDDSLIASLEIVTDRLLKPNADPSEVIAIIHVITKFVPFSNTQISSLCF